MAILGQHGEVSISVDGNETDGVFDAREIQVSMSFEEGAVQGSAVIENLTFVRDARQSIKQHIASGERGGVGLFEGIDFVVQVSNINQSQSVFDGYIDVSQAEIDDSNARILAPVIKSKTLEVLDARLSAINFGYLESIGVFVDADYVSVDYVVEKRNNAFESLVSAVLLYLMVKETAENVKDLAKDVATAVGIASGALTGGIGAAVFAFIAVGVQLAYTVVMVSAIINLGKDLINALVPPKRTHKAITYRKALDKIAGFLGMSINTDLSILNNCVYLPSNTTPDEFDNKGFIKKAGTITKGIPKAGDIGYNCSEFFGLVARIFNAKWGIQGDAIILRNRESDYWKKQASYTMPDILPPKYRYNTNELVANVSYNYSTDVSEEYTINNYRGTSYQVTTSPKVIGKASSVVIKGFEDVNFSVALATRKDELSGIEKVLSTVAKAIDDVIKVFGGNTNLEKSITNKVGVMKVGNNYHRVPKILYFENNRIPSNHRDIIGAKAIYENYYLQSSLANTAFSGQKLIYEGVEIPFNFNDFLKVLGNSYFYDSQGRLAKFIGKPLWNPSTSRATISYEVEQVYTRNLQENYNEQG